MLNVVTRAMIDDDDELMTNDNKDETLMYWTVCVVNLIILKLIFGLGKLSSASVLLFLASSSAWKVFPRPRTREFVLI